MDHKLELIKQFSSPRALNIALLTILKTPDYKDEPYFEPAKKVFESNFSLDSFVQFYNSVHNTNIQTADIEKLMALK